MKNITKTILIISIFHIFPLWGTGGLQLFAQPFFPKEISSDEELILKGSDTEYRNFWDVKKYEISVEPNFDNQSVSGTNKIFFEITKDIKNPVFQIDLQSPMQFELGTKNKNWSAERKGDFIFITSKKSYKKGEKGIFEFKFFGNPKIAKHAPWDGGWVFTKDKNGNHWASVAQEGNGVSLWLPTKDIWSDEPDEGILMKIITPENLVGVGNGRLISQTSGNHKNTFTWEVKNPINPYSIVPTIGKLVNFKDTFDGEKGKLDLDYWVLEENLEKAKKQFRQVQPMMKAFEYWFGAYPFYEDSYKLVETPYLGMEHQSNVGYGNRYENGYLGRDLSGTGVGLNWDFIIIHESGHEWFANNITAKDQADMWIHEGFTCYSETLFTEHFMDKNSGEKYLIGLRQNIQNDIPIIGKYGIRNEGSSDMYYKGANMLHTIRQIVGDDEKFREILRGLNRDFYHQTVTTKQIEDYISEKSGIDFSTIFDQYLRTVKIPILEYQQTGNQFQFRYVDAVDNLKLPVKINGNQIINPTKDWQTVSLESDSAAVFDSNYYIKYKNSHRLREAE
ncbi:MAG: M1 family metallopeptidase [Flavobacteriaceae bacterium]|jgi:aminopeptidase N|nr:M1 family metallopeptidase [Flavobacteriaceae bacterium]